MSTTILIAVWIISAVINYGFMLASFQYSYPVVAEKTYPVTCTATIFICLFSGPMTFVVGLVFHGFQYYRKSIYTKPTKMWSRVRELEANIFNGNNTINGRRYSFADIDLIIQKEFGYIK